MCIHHKEAGTCRDCISLERDIIERNCALETLNMDWARRIMPEATSDEVRIIAMHKARYECTGVSRRARLESASWLRQKKYKRLDMSQILPEGELPE